MHLITVIPISRGITIDELTYFSSTNFPVGAVISVPIRKKQTPAIVIKVSTVTKNKASLRSAKFELKKITKPDFQEVFLPSFIKAAQESSFDTKGTVGSVLASIVPTGILSTPPKLTIEKEKRDTNTKPARYALQADENERMAQYKSIIREAFARKESVFFALPAIHDIEGLTDKIGRGISNYTYVLHNDLSKKALNDTWKSAVKETHPVLIIGTLGFLGIPRTDMKTIIIENEASRGYKRESRPFLDLRTFAEHFAEHSGASLILGDTFLRIETLWRYHEHQLLERATLKFRSISTAHSKIVNMRRPNERKEGFELFSDDLRAMLNRTIENSEHTFLFSARRGLAPITVCGDCGTTVSCDHCGAPQVLHKTKDGNTFICHHCGKERDPLMKCSNCTGWKLTTLGIGVELIEEVIKEEFPHLTVFRIDADSTPTTKKMIDVRDAFYNTPGSVLIGTEKSLRMINQPVENSAIVSMDSLLALPDFRASERLFRILTHIRFNTQGELIVQTREERNRAIHQAIHGNLMDFYRDEISAREKFNYPPFSVLVRITIEGTPAMLTKRAQELETLFEDYAPYVFPARIKRKTGKTALHILLKIPQQEWHDTKLHGQLMRLPPTHTITIDPESILS